VAEGVSRAKANIAKQELARVKAMSAAQVWSALMMKLAAAIMMLRVSMNNCIMNDACSGPAIAEAS
jgi:hypothetical protein